MPEEPAKKVEKVEVAACKPSPARSARRGSAPAAEAGPPDPEAGEEQTIGNPLAASSERFNDDKFPDDDGQMPGPEE